MMAEAVAARVVPGRTCGSCTLCCKVFTVDWLTPPKVAGKWCQHCRPGSGCMIWQTVPQRCRDFECDWKTDAQLDDSWRPDRTGFVMFRQAMTNTYEITVDPGRPDAWRKKPYYSMLQSAAARLIPDGAMMVRLGWRQWLILPDGEIEVPPEHRNSDIKYVRGSPMLGREWQVEFVPRPVFG